MKIEILTAAQGEIVGELKQKKPTKQLLLICNGLRSSFRTLKTSDHNLIPLTETGVIVRMIDEWLYGL